MTRALVLLMLLVLPACSGLGRPGGELEIRSLESTAALVPAIRTACYRRIDADSADLYFSDISESRLADPADDLADAAGSIMHIHFFLEPSPGNTPIDDTACNATVRQVIFAPAEGGSSGQVFGIYGGGGFFFSSGSIGDDNFGGSMRQGTHRLLSSTPGFKDVLGPASIDGSVVAVRDDALALQIESRMAQFNRKAQASAP